MSVKLATLPDQQVHRVCVGASLRKPLPVLQAFLQSLDWQERPPRVELSYAFVNDGLASDAADFVRDWLKERGGTLLRGVPAAAADFVDIGVDSHQWAPSSMQRVGANKDKALQHARQADAAAVWLVDADLVLDRTTFASLWAADRPITTAVYWTYWTKRGFETRKVNAAPQVWLRHPYGLDGRGMDEATFRRRLLDRELLKVPGYGACTLISRRALDAGVGFAYLPDVPLVGLMAGEDRHFCLRAERLHIEAWADAWPDIYHIYHLPEDAQRIPEMLARLSVAHPARAALGDLVSLVLQPLEPVPHQAGWTMVRPQHIRGRLGALALMPEIEEAIYDIDRGRDVTVPVHFPVWHPIPYYRGKRRLVRVTLVDCKPLGWPPNLEDELFVGPCSGRAVRTADYSQRQLEGMAALANAST